MRKRNGTKTLQIPLVGRSHREKKLEGEQRDSGKRRRKAKSNEPLKLGGEIGVLKEEYIVILICLFI